MDANTKRQYLLGLQNAPSRTSLRICTSTVVKVGFAEEMHSASIMIRYFNMIAHISIQALCNNNAWLDEDHQSLVQALWCHTHQVCLHACIGIPVVVS